MSVQNSGLMEYWVYLVIIIVPVSFLLFRQYRRKKQGNLRAEYLEQWGKDSTKSYFHFNNIEQYFRNRSAKEEAWHIISDQVAADLDLNDLFRYVDRTISKIGQQYLYYKLRVIEGLKSLDRFQDIKDLMTSDEELRLDIQMQLARLSSHDNYEVERLINHMGMEKPSFSRFLFPLSLLAILSIVLGFFNIGFFFLLLPLFMLNAYFHYKTKSYIAVYQTAVSQLNKTHRVAEEIGKHKVLRNYFEDLDFIEGLKPIRSRMRFIEFERQMNDEYAILVWSILELFNIVFNFEAIVFFSFIDEVFKRQDQIHAMYCFLGELDCAQSVASLTYQNTSVCRPGFLDEKEIKFKGLKHPLVENCIANDLGLKGESLLLTGSNMSGKTTFIRALALSSLTAQTLNIAFAESFSIPFLKLYSSIRISDDLNESTSYYLKEVLVLKEFLAASKGEAPCLFIMDEIFKGTNTVERISGAKAMLSYLNNQKDMVFVSTHDTELADLLNEEAYALYHFSEQIVDGSLSFDHKLKEGQLKTRNAIEILDIYGYPKSIVEEARKTAEKQFGWTLGKTDL